MNATSRAAKLLKEQEAEDAIRRQVDESQRSENIALKNSKTDNWLLMVRERIVVDQPTWDALQDILA